MRPPFETGAFRAFLRQRVVKNGVRELWLACAIIGRGSATPVRSPLPPRAKPPSRNAERKPKECTKTRTKASKARQPAAAPPAEGEPKIETAISASRGLVDFLRTHRLSFALTSYQTGQLMLIGVLPDGRLSIFQRNFVRAMGLCAGAQRMYVSAIAQVWRLDNVLKNGQVANKQFDRLYVPRTAHTTGDLDIHEIAIDRDDRLVFVNTKYSCLATLDPVHSFRPLWHPSFISKLAPEDRCHLNGLAMQDGVPKYVTAVSRSDVVDGWRERRHEGGVIIDVETGRVVTEDLSMPHSPRLANGALWVLDFGARVSLPRRCGERQDRAGRVLRRIPARALLLPAFCSGRGVAAARQLFQGARTRRQYQGA